MKHIITGVFLCLVAMVNAQSNTVTSGATATGTTGSATYTIGQIDYQTNSGSNGTISQGVQQAFEIITLSNNEIPQIQLTATVFPNPTTQSVTLSITEFDVTKMNYMLFDMQGKVIAKGKIVQNETQIDMNFLAAAPYFITVTQDNKNLKTFKIIKK